MLRKANKSQIIKKIDVKDILKDNSYLYVPVIVNVAASISFGIKDLCVTIVPVNFIKNNSSGQSEDIEINSGFTLEEKPLFVKSSSKNNDSLKLSDVVPESSNSNLFKSIYAKNIVSTKGQEDFLEFSSPTFFNIDDEEDNKTFIVRIPLNPIENITRIAGDIYSGFIIKAYARNTNQEVLDNISQESKPISEYITTNVQPEIGAEIVLNGFVESFYLLFRSYNFPVEENYINNELDGFDIIFNSNWRQIFNNNNLDQSESILNISFDFEDTSFYQLPSINYQNIENFFIEETRLGSRFSFYSIKDVDLFAFISRILDSMQKRNLQEANININFNLFYLNQNFIINKKQLVSLSEITRFYEDVVKYRFELDVRQQRVISVDLSKASPIETILDNLYKVTIKINTQSYSREDILESSISLRFSSSSYEHLDIDEFYFDDGLTRDNSIIVNSSNVLKNYFVDGDTLDLYFSESSIKIEFCDIIFFNEGISEESFEIGPFRIKKSPFDARQINTRLLNQYTVCSRRMSQETEVLNSLSDFELIRRILRRESPLSYRLNASNIFKDNDFINLGYFESSLNLSSEAAIREVLNNTIITIKKSLFLDSIEIENKTYYKKLSEVSNIVKENDTLYVTIKGERFLGLLRESNFEERFRSERRVNKILDSIMLNESVDENFTLTYEEKLNYVLMKNGVMLKFGENVNIQNEKENLIDFIITNNANYRMTNLVRLVNVLFSEQYYNDKDAFKNVLETSGIDNLFMLNDRTSINQNSITISETNESLENLNLEQAEDLLYQPLTSRITNINRLNLNANSSSLNQSLQIYNVRSNKKTNLLIENVRYCSTEIKANLFNGDIILQKNSNDNDIVLFDNNISNLTSLYQNSANSTVSDAFFYVELELNPQYTTRSQVENENFNYYVNERSAFITFKNSLLNDYKQKLNINISNKIVANLKDSEIFFERFDREYYTLISTLLDPVLLSNGRLNPQSSRVPLIVKNIFFRICITLRINNMNYTILKNIPIISKNRLREYVLRHSLNYTENQLNINFLDDSQNKIFMPNITYKGTSL